MPDATTEFNPLSNPPAEVGIEEVGITEPAPPELSDALTTNMGALLAAAGVLPPHDVNYSSDKDQTKHAISHLRQERKSHEIESSGGHERRASRLKSVPSLGTSPTALQDLFLNAVRREAIECTLYLNGGGEECGVVRAFDTFTLLLENHDTRHVQLIYKHAIARILPVRAPNALFERGAPRAENKAASKEQKPRSN